MISPDSKIQLKNDTATLCCDYIVPKETDITIVKCMNKRKKEYLIKVDNFWGYHRIKIRKENINV